jgi:Uma2 family endonuclease
MPKEDAAMSASLTPPMPAGPMTVEEFCELPDDPSGASWQLVEGEPVMMAPASTIHGRMQGNLATLLNNHLWQARPGCSVITAPGVIPRVRRDSNVRIPDLVVQCGTTPRGETVLEDPILAIEILSIGNRAETWANVWTYTTIPSLQEILVIRTASVAAEILRRNSDLSWPERFEPVVDAVRLDSIGFSFPIIAAYRGTELADV